MIVIGGGPAGETCAATVVKGGLSALLVESELVGGECPYWACVPSKALLRPSETISSVKAVGGARERWQILQAKYGGGKVEVDMEGVWARRDRFTKGWNDGVPIKMMVDAGVDVVHGFGSVSGVKKVSVKDWHSGETVELEAKVAVVIATGSAPVIPNIQGLKDSKYWTPREAVSAREVPGSLIVLGAGAVGTELATAYNQFGSKVTIVASKILSRNVPEASKRVHESLIDSGVDVVTNKKVVKVERAGSTIVATFGDGSPLEANELLIAAGRNARTHGVGLEKVGVDSEGAWVRVDDSLCAKQVSDGWLYAIGDTNGLSPFTHMGKYQAGIAGAAIVAKSKGKFEDGSKTPFGDLSIAPSNPAIPQVIFSDPQVAFVGVDLKQAKAKGFDADARSVTMQGAGTFLHSEGYKGWAEWVFDKNDGRLLGATFVGRDVANLLHASTVAIVGGMTIQQLVHAVPSFPTISEVYTSLVEACKA